MSTLTALANYYGTDKGDTHYEAHNYTPTLERYLDRMKEQPICLVEIGVNDPRFPGASLRMWDKYLTNLRSIIIGIDKDLPLLSDVSSRVKLLQADQSSACQLKRVSRICPHINVLIDDGSHHSIDQITSFLALFPLITAGGLYFIEDCHARDCARTIELFGCCSWPFMHIEKVSFSNHDKLIIIRKKDQK
jgi:hypothetical protein